MAALHRSQSQELPRLTAIDYGPNPNGAPDTVAVTFYADHASVASAGDQYGLSVAVNLSAEEFERFATFVDQHRQGREKLSECTCPASLRERGQHSVGCPVTTDQGDVVV